jgi:hypothetical protein
MERDYVGVVPIYRSGPGSVVAGSPPERHFLCVDRVVGRVRSQVPPAIRKVIALLR